MKTEVVNNEFYNELGEQWYQDKKHPIALLRAEQKVKNPWVEQKIKESFKERTDLNILDIGCGAGFLTNHLAKTFDHVYGVDASEPSLEIAKKYDTHSKVKYLSADAYKLPFEDNSMDVVCAMDFLEHVEDPRHVIKEAARVLKKDGVFFFHTFNRNFLSWLVVIKFMEWFMPNTPKNLHILRLFIRPDELKVMMAENALADIEWKGLRPSFDIGFWKSFIQREVRDDFSFKICGDLKLGYLGFSRKIN